jgi:hypothetical protein
VWLTQLQQCYASDPKAQDIIAKLSLESSAVPHFTFSNGVLRFKGRIWLNSYTALQAKVFSALHASALGGHSGAPVTYQRIVKLFHWPTMKSDILSWVQSCFVCQQAKPNRSKYPGLLQPLPVPDAAWDIVSMDFVEGLPKSGSVNAILVVVDKFTKFSHFVPLHHPFYCCFSCQAVYGSHLPTSWNAISYYF